MKNSILILFLLSFLRLSAQDVEQFGMDSSHIPKGLEIGAKAPNFKRNDILGAEFSLASTLNEKKVVLIFYRGQWCPYCSRHLSNISDSLELIYGKNAVVVAVGPETPENAEKIKNKVDAEFILISDSDLQIMRDYDVLFKVTSKYKTKIKTLLLTSIENNNGQEEAQLPVPATYVIGKDGKIKFRQFQYDYKSRSSVKAILDALD